MKVNNKLFIGCFIFSILLHFFGLFLLQKHTFLLYSNNFFKNQNSYRNITNLKKNHLMKLVFKKETAKNNSYEKLSSFVPEQAQLIPLSDYKPLDIKEKKTEEIKSTESGFKKSPIEEPSLSLKQNKIKNTEKLSFSSSNIIDEIKKIIPEEVKVSVKTEKKFKPQTEREKIDYYYPFFEPETKRSFNYLNATDDTTLVSTHQTEKKQPQKTQMISSILDMPSLESLATTTCGKDFDTIISYCPQKDKYIFAITIIPKGENNFKKIKKNVFFLLDHSNSIQKKRLNITRHAISASFPFLDKNDHFNIIAFDNNINLLSQKNLTPSNDNFFFARNFLRKLSLGSFFSSTNFFIPLNQLLSHKDKKDEINIAILLTNGDDFNKFNNIKLIDAWTKSNNGNLSLYILSLLEDKNLTLLDFFSSLNKGKLIFSSTHNGLRRKLQKLLKSIDYPIAKNVSSKAISYSQETKIKLFYPTNQLPNFYLNEPYVIMGETNRLDDFALFIQGTHADQYFNIKKKITFDNAQRVEGDLLKEWDILQAYQEYKLYLHDKKNTHLKKAEKILKNWDIESAL